MPFEDKLPGDDNKLRKFKLLRDGTRDAATNLQNAYMLMFEMAGSTNGRASPCNVHNAQRNIALAVHGDDPTAAVVAVALARLKQQFDADRECRREAFGPGREGQQKSESATESGHGPREV